MHDHVHIHIYIYIYDSIIVITAPVSQSSGGTTPGPLELTPNLPPGPLLVLIFKKEEEIIRELTDDLANHVLDPRRYLLNVEDVPLHIF